MTSKTNRAQRVFIWVMVMVGGFLLILALFALLSLAAVNDAPRTVARADAAGVTVQQWGVLPGEDAYPAAVAVAADGTAYTGSYATGALYRVAPDGTTVELSGARETVGSVAGLALLADGTLLVVDQLDSDARTGGGELWRVTFGADDTVSVAPFGDVPGGLIVPDDAAQDAAGNVYVTDRGSATVWRFAPDGTGAKAWWVMPAPSASAPAAPAGIAFDPANAALLVTDPFADLIYRLPVDDPAGAQVIYRAPENSDPGFDGLLALADGRIFIAATGQNRLVTLTPDGALTTLASGFRGISDVDGIASDGGPGDGALRLVVTNFDSFALVVPGVRPRLPFALDEVLIGE